MAAIELTVRELGHDVAPVMAALSIATRSLSRELAGREVPVAIAVDALRPVPQRA